MGTETMSAERVVVEARRMQQAEAARPLAVAIMGQTGVGKSSLLNALFGTSLTVGDVTPTTKIPEPVSIVGSNDHEITFWDLPGIGESAHADAKYMDIYRAKIIECDVVLWAIHADSRSTVFDLEALHRLLPADDPATATTLLSKLTFVLTKSDAIARAPWIFATRGAAGTFVPSGPLETTLQEKSAYFEEQLLSDFGQYLTSTTYVEPGFVAQDRRLVTDTHHVRFTGHVTDEVHRQLLDRHPGYSDLIDRLRDNHRPIACSARYRYQLVRLLSVVVNKIGTLATGRFERLIGETSDLDTVPTGTVRTFGPFVVWDVRRGRKAFDLNDVSF